jgi:5'-3' exonuclease
MRTFPRSVVLIDGNNLGFAAQMSGGARLSVGALETTALYGFLRALRKLREEHAGKPIVLWDGRSWRYEEYPDYKAGRDDRPEMRELRQSWSAARPMVAGALRDLGVSQVIAANMEADDMAARMRRVYADHGTTVTLISSDHDWLQLVGEGVSLFDPRKARHVTLASFEDHVKLPSPMALAEMKALVGDKSDNIPGVGGIGEKTAQAILARWGSVPAFVGALRDNLDLRLDCDRRQLSLVDDPDKMARFARNMRLIWLDHVDAPETKGARHIGGALNREAFARCCEEWAFVSILKSLDEWVQPFARKDH